MSNRDCLCSNFTNVTARNLGSLDFMGRYFHVILISQFWFPLWSSRALSYLSKNDVICAVCNFDPFKMTNERGKNRLKPFCFCSSLLMIDEVLKSVSLFIFTVFFSSNLGYMYSILYTNCDVHEMTISEQLYKEKAAGRLF